MIAFDRNVGHCVDRVSLVDQILKRLLRMFCFQQGPVAAPADALPQGVEIRPEPNGNGIFKNYGPRPVIHEGAAAGRQNTGRLRQQSLDDTFLPLPEGLFAMFREDFIDRAAGGFLDLLVRIQERQLQPRGELPADGGLACAHHAYQHEGHWQVRSFGICHYPWRRSGEFPSLNRTGWAYTLPHNCHSRKIA